MGTQAKVAIAERGVVKAQEMSNVEKAILERRSVRQYQKTDVPDAFIEKLLSAALWAPSGM